MTTYLDSSVILRIVLNDTDQLKGWDGIEHGVTCSLTEVECLRTVDRLRVHARMPDSLIAPRLESLFQMLGLLEVIEMTRPLLARASLPLPVALRTLDAIHLAAAMTWRDGHEDEFVLATHDNALALAARAMGMTVIGA